MADSLETQLLVLGGGPGGYAAAFLAADRGMQVTLVDAAPRIGGACLHVGCIPSKILLHAASLLSGAEEAVSWGLKFARPEIDLNVLRGKKDKIVDALSGHLVELARRRQVTLVTGRGTLTDGQTLQVENGPRIRFQNCILATGSSSVRLPVFDIGSPRVLDSSSALKLDDVPASLLIVGGGYIGLELGTVFAALGSKVTVVELTGSLLPGVDADLVRPLAARLQTRFDKILLNTKVVKVADEKTGIRRNVRGKRPVVQAARLPRLTKQASRLCHGLPALLLLTIQASRLCHGSTRCWSRSAGVLTPPIWGWTRPVSPSMNAASSRVDNQRRTSNTHIFAIGDLAGNPMLAHKAAHEGKLVVKVLSGEDAIWDPRAIPAVVFTDPEIAWCGLTETEAKQQGREVKSAKFYWAASGRAATLGRSDGVTKLLVDPKTDQLLGVGIVGHGAAELIAEAVVAIEMGAVSKDLALCIHPHPTLSETIGQAAETLHGLATDIYVRKRSGLPSPGTPGEGLGVKANP